MISCLATYSKRATAAPISSGHLYTGMIPVDRTGGHCQCKAQVSVQGVLASDLTLAQVKTLNAVQRLPAFRSDAQSGFSGQVRLHSNSSTLLLLLPDLCMCLHALCVARANRSIKGSPACALHLLVIH